MAKRADRNPKITYPSGCKELNEELSKDELVKRLKVCILQFTICTLVPRHRTDWDMRSFAFSAGPSSWNVLPIDLRSSGLDTFAKHLKTHLFREAYS